MARLFQTYLKTYRKQAHLTQDELAYLLGLSEGSKVSKLERSQLEPTLRVAFAAQITFGATPHEVFTGIWEEVEGLLINRAEVLWHSQRAQEGTARQQQKLRHLAYLSEGKSIRHLTDDELRTQEGQDGHGIVS